MNIETVAKIANVNKTPSELIETVAVLELLPDYCKTVLCVIVDQYDSLDVRQDDDLTTRFIFEGVLIGTKIESVHPSQPDQVDFHGVMNETGDTEYAVKMRRILINVCDYIVEQQKRIRKSEARLRQIANYKAIAYKYS